MKKRFYPFKNARRRVGAGPGTVNALDARLRGHDTSGVKGAPVVNFE